MTKKVAVKWCARSSGRARDTCPFDASSNVSSTGLGGSRAPRATCATTASALTAW